MSFSYLYQKQPFQPVTILLVYRKHHDHRSQFLFNLRQMLLTNTVHIVLGDFNMDFFINDINNPKQLIEGDEAIQVALIDLYQSKG